jgi:hypothetical protein
LRSLISMEGGGDGGGGGGELSTREAAAAQRTRDCLQACHIADIFADSKFLQARCQLAPHASLCRAVLLCQDPHVQVRPLALCLSRFSMSKLRACGRRRRCWS